MLIIVRVLLTNSLSEKFLGPCVIVMMKTVKRKDTLEPVKFSASIHTIANSFFTGKMPQTGKPLETSIFRGANHKVAIGVIIQSVSPQIVH